MLFVQDVGKKNGERLLFLSAPLKNEMPISPGHSREPNSKKIELKLHEDCFVHCIQRACFCWFSLTGV